MSAMKMDFICEDSPEGKRSPPPPRRAANANAQLSKLLNSTSQELDSDAEMETAAVATPPASPSLSLSPSPSPSPSPSTSDDHHHQQTAEEEENDAARDHQQSPRKRAKTKHHKGEEAAKQSAEDMKNPAAAAAAAVVNSPRTESPVGNTDQDGNGLSDHENSEDEQVEYAPWEDVDLNPAVDIVNKVVRESLEAGKTYNKSITAKTSQLLAGCDNVLLELKNLSDARETSRKQSSKQNQQDGDCACGVALSMFPLVAKEGESQKAGATGGASVGGKAARVDEIAEDQTDRVLCKIEASMERLRELAELIQATSMQGEANLISKVTLPDGVLNALNTAIQASAATATASAIAQERGRLMASSAFGRLYSPLQTKKLQDWYYAYPRPLTDELTLMRTILNYRPFANPFLPSGLAIAHIRDWFKRRRYRERVRYVKLAVEAGRDPVAAEEEIDLRIEQRIEHLRVTVDPNELVKELDKVRAESAKYDSMIASFARPETLDAYVSASLALPSVADQMSAHHSSRAKRQRTQDAELEDAIVVKVGSHVEVNVLQNRMRTLLAMPRTALNTNALQQVVDVLRSMEVSKEVRVQTGVVADLKKILKAYRKPALLRKATIALLENLGMSRRVILNDDAHDEAPTNVEATSRSGSSAKLTVKTEELEESGSGSNSPAMAASPVVSMSATSRNSKSKSKSSSRGKKQKGKIQRPMKFSMKQVMALEGWFQQKYKPTQGEMEGYLDQLNCTPLRDEKQPVDVNMTQLRRWFNKRRCLRRPPFALMTQQEAAKEGSKNPAVLKAAASDLDIDMLGDDASESMPLDSPDNSEDDSSDDDGDSSDDE